ncbi:MAG TPA: hypothetical protein VHB20_03135 [Verrucomicrobiae bacterium]|jgi:hypothetical protein|nr:hypothetical protein [Verrucomicrobiae bacterium]
MNGEHLLIWFTSGKAQAVGLRSLPDSSAFTFDGVTFYRIPEYLGDVDYLRDDQGRLVGFAWMLGDDDYLAAVRDELLPQSEAVKVSDGMLIILLEERPFEVKCVQAMGSELYRSETKGLMVTVPNWGFGAIGFPLIHSHTPVAVVN